MKFALVLFSQYCKPSPILEGTLLSRFPASRTGR